VDNDYKPYAAARTVPERYIAKGIGLIEGPERPGAARTGPDARFESR
jgi:hypothetical protein